MSSFTQILDIAMRTGHSYKVQFDIEEDGKLNSQIDKFFKAVTDPKRAVNFFLFSGSTIVLLDLREVIGASVRNEKRAL